MKHALPPLTRDLIETFAASALAHLVWLGRVVSMLAAPHKSRRLHRFVERLERGVESILFLQAVHRFGPPPRRRHAPRSTPPGFRRADNARLRLFFRNSGVRARKASLAQRLASLARALANPAPHVAYFFKRLCRGLRAGRLIPCAPPAAACASLAAPPTAFADSS